ncbi:isopeptide-forming domain-containing fimbrial protein [Ileibacterium valens]|uniref:isopeptide-forming domain-containing fimbrial protein n=1 Tax=Ileibacterium valens TaxID=1862668 RepID=UPI002352802F|nr:SpaA isopeptide-forming pilin-related protein [Ileibacterium valens]
MMNKYRNSRFLHISRSAITFAAAALLYQNCPEPAFAFEPNTLPLVSESTNGSGQIDFQSGNASLTIVGNQGQSLQGKTFNLYRLFNVSSSADQASINYTWNPEYKDALQSVISKRTGKPTASIDEAFAVDYILSLREPGVSPNPGASSDQPLQSASSDFRLFVEELTVTLIQNDQPDYTVKVTGTSADNRIVISGLEYGYYLIDEDSGLIPSSQAASLTMMTTLNPSSQLQIKSDLPTVEKQVGDKAQNQNPSGNWQIMSDFEIGARVPFRYLANVPNMTGYTTYQFIFHDQLNSALTFDPSSVSIKLTDASGNAKTVPSSDYQIIQNADPNETFSIRFTDLKSVVNRLFPGSGNQNSYGQQMEIEYTATLNETAADQTGKPLENRVRLEFSNNPKHTQTGQTEFTPWEETAVFTYQLDNLKVNNQDAPLAGAKFRLYYDEACTNEVILKKGTNGYVVLNPDTAAGGTGEEIVSEADGSFVIYGLDAGTYYLKETAAPDGYRPIQDPIKIIIESTFNAIPNQGLSTLHAKASTTTYYMGVASTNTKDLQTNLANGSIQNKIVNQIGDQLPSTGSYGAAVLLGAGVIAISTGAYLLSSRKKSKAGKIDQGSLDRDNAIDHKDSDSIMQSDHEDFKTGE